MSNTGAVEYLIPSNVIGNSNTLLLTTTGSTVRCPESPADNPPPVTTTLGVNTYPSPESVIVTSETTKF